MKTIALILAIFTGPLGVHRLYLGSPWGIIYLPLLYIGIVLTAAIPVELRVLGRCMLGALALLWLLDVIRIVTGRLSDRQATIGRAKFVIVGLLGAFVLTVGLGGLMVVTRLVPLPGA